MGSADPTPHVGDTPFNAADMQRYFAELDDTLAQEGVDEQLHLFVAGGAVIATRTDARLTTDVDVVSDGMTDQLRRCVADVAQRHPGLRTKWLNDDAIVKRVNLPMEPDRLYEGRTLVIDSAGDRYVLAMKLASGRHIDRPDCELLIRSLGITDLGELIYLIQQGVPESRQHPAMALFAAERLRDAYPSQSRSPRSGEGLPL
ncbi:hypothetical protein [Candidatus Poriferisodalis sp.]|uniref:hypothetical protein n=1 Tax=Candidatus Poriferisodalis sp. TaxID=3101277 RepID=UPI003B021D61